MSFEAISWAFQQCIQHSSAKFVLVAMSNHADENMRCWPSIPHLCKQTSQDRKTVQTNLQRLREWGYIVDTGERKGTTKQVVVYQFNIPENGFIEYTQKRDSTGNGTVPFLPVKSTGFPAKEAQISLETGPKTGHGTYKNLSITNQEPINKKEAKGTRLSSDWKPSIDDASFCKTERPDLVVDNVAAQFRDYWVAQPGSKGRKSDWSATWRNWVRRQSVQSRTSSQHGRIGQQSRHSGFDQLNYAEGVSDDGRF